jgi:hypothetical protein
MVEELVVSFSLRPSHMCQLPTNIAIGIYLLTMGTVQTLTLTENLSAV